MKLHNIKRLLPNRKQHRPEQIVDLRQQELRMIDRLQSIDLTDPQRRLSDEKVQALNIPDVINLVCRELESHPCTDQAFARIYKCMDHIIQVLENAVECGLEMTAEQACTALVFAVRELRTDIADMDLAYAEAVMASRTEYAHNMALLVQMCREHDRLQNDLAELRGRRNAQQEELTALTDNIQTRKDSGALDSAIACIKEYADNPAEMSDEVLALREELSRIHWCKENLQALNTTFNVMQAELDTRSEQIATIHGILSVPPRVTDPTLMARFNESTLRYRQNLNDILNTVLAARSDDKAPLLEKIAQLEQEVKTLREQLAARKVSEFHSRPDRMTFSELTDIDDL